MKDPTLLIDRLEAYAARHPDMYRFRVALLAALGYGYLLLIVLMLLAVVYVTLAYVRVSYITLKVVWIPLVLVGIVLRSLWITIPEPDGKELRYEQATRLFDLVHEIRGALNGPKVHRVLLSDEFNAGIVQIPRFGMFGWLRNYLVVGLPLLKALSPEEFRSVLAHEFGHLSGKHGRFSGWVYHLRLSWIQILDTVHQERHYASFLFEPFLNWYAPFFNVYSFVLARAQEREADEYSVEIAGRDVAGRALVRMDAKEHALGEEFWPDFYQPASEQSQPPKDPFSQMLDRIERPIEGPKAEKWFLQSLRVTTGYDDTHPALADRLTAMGFQREQLDSASGIETLVQTNGANGDTAASYYLNELPEEFLLSFNRLWKEGIAQTWTDRHNYLQQAQRRLNELDEKAKTEALTIDEQWERARLLVETKEPTAALPAIRQILEASPEHVGANFALGVILLEQQDAAGIKHLEKAMELDASNTTDACEQIYVFHREQGHRDEAEAYRVRAQEYAERVKKQHEKAMKFTPDDHFEPHGLDQQELQDLQRQLGEIGGLSAAYLVRKIISPEVPSLGSVQSAASGTRRPTPDTPPAAPEPLYVFGVIAGYTFRDGRSEKNSGALLNELASNIQFSRPTVFVTLEGTHEFLRDKLRAVAGAQIFPRLNRS